jgi:hypothetical protein
MDGKRLRLWTGISAALLVALAGAAAGGAYAGVRWHASFIDSLVRQVESGELDRLRDEIRLLDQGELPLLRERLTAAQSSRLLTVCTFASDSSAASKPFVADEWEVLRRIAVYRRDHPAPSPPGIGAAAMEPLRTVNERIGACLDAALRRPQE